MRVTKTVKEYIAKQVASKFPKTEIELYQEQQEQIASKMNQEYYDRVEKAKAEILKQIVFNDSNLSNQQKENFLNVIDSYSKVSDIKDILTFLNNFKK